MENKPVQKLSAFERVKELEDELEKTKYNKRTQHHIGLLKARIALLREKQRSRGSKAKGAGFSDRKELEDELEKTKYNKRTQHHIGLLKARIALLREKQRSRGSKAKGAGFSVKKSG